jgi:hypothetical protein
MSSGDPAPELSNNAAASFGEFTLMPQVASDAWSERGRSVAAGPEWRIFGSVAARADRWVSYADPS